MLGAAEHNASNIITEHSPGGTRTTRLLDRGKRPVIASGVNENTPDKGKTEPDFASEFPDHPMTPAETKLMSRLASPAEQGEQDARNPHQ